MEWIPITCAEEQIINQVTKIKKRKRRKQKLVQMLEIPRL